MRIVERTDERIISADIFDRDAKVARAELGSHHEAARDIPVYRNCQVLVVGSGPSGTAAAVARPAAEPTWCCWSAIATWAACPPAAK